MFERHLTKNLKEGEEVLRFVRRTPWSLLLPAAATAVVLLSPFFFLFPLLRLGVPGVAAIAVLGFFGVFLLARLVVIYSLNVLLITNQRLIDVDQRGFFHREVSECSYDKIADVSFSIKGVGQTFLRYGNLQIQTAGSQANIEVRSVRDPQRAQELISKLQAEYADRAPESGALSAEELLRLAQRLRDGLGEEQFRRFVDKRH